MRLLDIWMFVAGWTGRWLPLPSLWWTWHRWAHEVRGQNGHNKTYVLTLVSLGAASLAVASWTAAVLCFFKHSTVPINVCGPELAAPTMGSLCVVAIVSASFGAKRCRWTTILCAIGMVLYFFPLGIWIE